MKKRIPDHVFKASTSAISKSGLFASLLGRGLLIMGTLLLAFGRNLKLKKPSSFDPAGIPFIWKYALTGGMALS